MLIEQKHAFDLTKLALKKNKPNDSKYFIS